MKTINDTSKLYKGRPRGYYDPTPTEVFFTELGQEIFKYTDNNQHKTQMTDEDWITHCDAANKCVRFGTLYGPKSVNDFKPEMCCFTSVSSQYHHVFELSKMAKNYNYITNTYNIINRF